MNYEIYNGTTRWPEAEMTICPEHLKQGVSVVYKEGDCPLCNANEVVEILACDLVDERDKINKLEEWLKQASSWCKGETPNWLVEFKEYRRVKEKGDE